MDATESNRPEKNALKNMSLAKSFCPPVIFFPPMFCFQPVVKEI